MKEYLKPEAEYISLQAKEEVTAKSKSKSKLTEDDDFLLFGETGVESSIFDS